MKCFNIIITDTTIIIIYGALALATEIYGFPFVVIVIIELSVTFILRRWTMDGRHVVLSVEWKNIFRPKWSVFASCMSKTTSSSSSSSHRHYYYCLCCRLTLSCTRWMCLFSKFVWVRERGRPSSQRTSMLIAIENKNQCLHTEDLYPTDTMKGLMGVLSNDAQMEWSGT